MCETDRRPTLRKSGVSQKKENHMQSPGMDPWHKSEIVETVKRKVTGK